MSDETIAKSVPWLARLIQDELIPLLQQLVERLPKRSKAAPSPFAQPELPGIGGVIRTPPATAAMPLTFAPQDTAELPDGLCWTNPQTPEPDAPTVHEAQKRQRHAKSNTVIVWEIIFARFRHAFWLEDLADAGFLAEVSDRTHGRVKFASMSKILSVLRRAGAATRDAAGKRYRVNEPTDELRREVERLARRRGGDARPTPAPTTEEHESKEGESTND